MAKMGSNSDTTAESTYMPAGSADKFSKAKILSSGLYRNSEYDVVATLLEDGESYTLAEVKEKLKEFKAGEA